MRIYNLLSFRLFLLIVIILTVLTISYSYYFVSLETRQYEEFARQCAERTSLVITGSTKNAMLLNQKDKAFEIMKSIASQEGIEKICLYNKKGYVVYSTVESEIGKKVSLTYRSCSPCHTPEGEVRGMPINKWHNIYTNESENRNLSYLKPIKNEESCYTAGCHTHTSEQSYIGVLCVVMSLQRMDALVEENKSQMISINIIFTIVLGLAVGVFIWIWVHVPVKKLIKGTREISSGNLEYIIPDTSKDEMGMLGRSFNEMTTDIRKAKEEITTWSNQLENRVKEKTEALENTQKRNLQIEKMASLGQLSATVAHELNNPMAGILTYSKLIQKKINKGPLSEEERDSVLKHLKMIESESTRSGEIVKNMLLFSRQEAIDMKPHKLDEIIDSSLDLISHHLKLNNIQLEKDLQPDLPPIDVDENQIKQALLALYVNAVEAMDDEGTLTVRTSLIRSKQQVMIIVEDTGKGIPDSVKSQVFEPFFTTKNEVKGVGLGLAAVYAIIQKHGADIYFESEVNKGTTFKIIFPLTKSRDSKA
jgi:two-component system NtrC family sensor kinase